MVFEIINKRVFFFERLSRTAKTKNDGRVATMVVVVAAVTAITATFLFKMAP